MNESDLEKEKRKWLDESTLFMLEPKNETEDEGGFIMMLGPNGGQDDQPDDEDPRYEWKVRQLSAKAWRR